MRWRRAGLLNRDIGGPSVFPYQPAGLWEELSRGETFTAQEYHESEGPRPLPPQHVHVLETHRAAGRAHHLRRARSREMHLPPPHHQHAAAGPGAAERSDLRGGRARAGAARHARSRAATRRRACASSSARPPRAAPRRPRCASCSIWPSAACEHYKKQPRTRGEADRDRRVEAGQSWKPPNWPPGPWSPAPSSTSTRPSPRNSHGDHTASFLFADQHRHRHRRARLAAGGGRLRRRDDQTGGLPGLPHFRTQGQARGLPAPVGRPFADGPVRLQADARKARRHRTARQHPHGPAHHRHDLGPDQLSRSRGPSSSSSSTGNPAPGSASCCRTRRRSSTTSPSSRR